MHISSRLYSAAAQPTALKLSAVHRGNAFEERGLKILQDHLSMSLRRVGGKSDGGIDLQGWWWLPPALGVDPSSLHTAQDGEERRRLRVLAQCKAEKKKFSPNYVREMEGVLHRYLANKDTSSANGETVYPHVALLLSESAFTASTLLRAQSSPIPFFLLHLPPLETEEKLSDSEEGASHGTIGSAFWNPALGGQRGILGGEIEARWERAVRGGGRPGLWWQGERLRSWTPDGYTNGLEDGPKSPV